MLRVFCISISSWLAGLDVCLCTDRVSLRGCVPAHQVRMSLETAAAKSSARLEPVVQVWLLPGLVQPSSGAVKAPVPSPAE